MKQNITLSIYFAFSIGITLLLMTLYRLIKTPDGWRYYLFPLIFSALVILYGILKVLF